MCTSGVRTGGTSAPDALVEWSPPAMEHSETDASRWRTSTTATREATYGASVCGMTEGRSAWHHHNAPSLCVSQGTRPPRDISVSHSISQELLGACDHQP